MTTIMYINIYLILTRKISKQIFLKKKSPMKKNIIIIKIITIIGNQGSIIIMVENIFIREEIIIMKTIEERGVFQGMIIIIQKVWEVVEVKVINIILNIINIDIEIINLGQIVAQKKIFQEKNIRILLPIQNQIPNRIQSQIQNLRVLLIQINLPYYIPIQ